MFVDFNLGSREGKIVWGCVARGLIKACLQVLWAALVCGLRSSFDVILAMWVQASSWEGWHYFGFIFVQKLIVSDKK